MRRAELKMSDAERDLKIPTDETLFWLELLEGSELIPAGRLTEIKQEADGLAAITVASIKIARINHPR